MDDDRYKELSSEPSKVPKLLRAIRDWAFTSRMFPTALSGLMDPLLSENAFVESVNGINKTRRDDLRRSYLLRALGPDGYDPQTQELTCADGTTVPFAAENYNWKMFLVTLFALPSRPESVVSKYSGGEEDEKRNRICYQLHEEDYLYIPQYSLLQILRNLIGGWNPIKETINGNKPVEQAVDEVNEKAVVIPGGGDEAKMMPLEEEKQQQKASFYLRRWTEKKVFLIALAVIRVPLFVAFNLVTWPFRFVRNILKLFTEFLLPVASLYLLNFSVGFLLDRQNDLSTDIKRKGRSWHLLWQIPAYGILGLFNLAVGIFQYAITLICRAGLAFTSPLKSALLAYNSGVLILGSDHSASIFSRFVGALGFVLSLALSATLWAIAMPLALGALVTAVPALLAPITALSQSPFIAYVLGWLTQLPFVATLSTAFGTAFGVVGGALTATFGAAIGYLGAMVGVAIPQVVVAFSLIMSVIVMPALTLVTWGVEALSNAIMRWVEQRPFHTLFTKPKKGATAPDEHKAGQTEVTDTVFVPVVPDIVYVHQARPGGACIVSADVCHMVATFFEGNNAVKRNFEALEVKDPIQRNVLWAKAYAGEGIFTQKIREAKKEDYRGTKDEPAVVKIYS